jgi:hypothetical protein
VFATDLFWESTTNLPAPKANPYNIILDFEDGSHPGRVSAAFSAR